MLTIRQAQLRALGHGRARAFQQEVAQLLWREWTDRSPGLTQQQVAEIVAFSATSCHEKGLDRAATVIEFAEAMLKDEEHPLTQARMAQKSQIVLRELQSRLLFETLLAMQAAQPGAAQE